MKIIVTGSLGRISRPLTQMLHPKRTSMKNLLTILILSFYAISIYGQKFKQPPGSRPFVLGEIHELQSKVLGEKRILNIYLPKSYNPKDSIKYPVIYLLDGSADEDFIHIVGLVQYYSFEWINQLPKSIVVGIATIDRRRDFTFPTTIEADRKRYPTTGHSNLFIAFLATELQPFIDKNFKTTQSKTLIGQSLGGLLATEILFKTPTLFNKYIIVSPSLWWNNGSLLDKRSELLNATFKQQTDIYIGVGKEGPTPTAIPRVMEEDANLLADKISKTKSKTVNVLFDYLPQEDHATIMHQAVSNAFRQLNEVKNPKQ
ncbi:MAG: alpha/beta hydrolase-fold protein [Ferruginibacter sp.]